MMKLSITFIAILLGHLLQAQSHFIHSFASESDTIGYGGAIICEKNGVNYVFSGKPQIKYDEFGAYITSVNTVLEAFSATGNRIWSTPINPVDKGLPQFDSDGCIVNDTSIYLHVNYLRADGQTSNILRFDHEGTLLQEYESPIGEFEFFGNIHFFNNNVILLSRLSKEDGLEEILLRYFSPTLELLSTTSLLDIPPGQSIFRFDSWHLGDAQLVYSYALYNPNSGSISDETIQSIQLTDQTNMWQQTMPFDFRDNTVVGPYPGNATSLYRINRKFDQNFSATECSSLIKNNGDIEPLNCEGAEPDLVFLRDIANGLSGHVLCVGEAIIEENPNPESLRRGYIAQYDSTGVEVWKRILLDTVTANNSTALGSCSSDGLGGIFFTGSSTDYLPDSTIVQRMIIGHIDVNGCVGNSCGDTLYVQSATSISMEPLITENSLKIYPNPAKDMIYVDLEDSGFEPERASVVDVYGRIARQYSAVNDLSFQVTTLPVGLYSILLFDQNGRFKRSVFIKN